MQDTQPWQALEALAAQVGGFLCFRHLFATCWWTPVDSAVRPRIRNNAGRLALWADCAGIFLNAAGVWADAGAPSARCCSTSATPAPLLQCALGPQSTTRTVCAGVRALWRSAQHRHVWQHDAGADGGHAAGCYNFGRRQGVYIVCGAGVWLQHKHVRRRLYTVLQCRRVWGACTTSPVIMTWLCWNTLQTALTIYRR